MKKANFPHTLASSVTVITIRHNTEVKCNQSQGHGTRNGLWVIFSEFLHF